jgi:membrane fusion protein, multidrug efflux system
MGGAMRIRGTPRDRQRPEETVSIRLLRAPAAALVLALGVTLAGCKAKQIATSEPPPPPVHVETVDAVEQPVPRVLALTGTLRGSKQTDLAANAAGRVQETLVERGSPVKAGDLVARLDVRSAALSANEARAAADLTRTQALSAKRECDRYKALLDQNAISRAEYDRVTDQCSTSSLSIAAAQARASMATQVVGDGMIRAPFAGIVAQRYVEVGEYVRQDSKVATIVAIDALRLEFSVPEANIGAVKQGGTMTFTVPAYPGRTFAGVVRFVGAALRETTRDLVAEALVDNADQVLRPGMFASVALRTGEMPLPIIPKSAVVEKEGRSHVFVLAEQRIEERVVQTTAFSGDQVAVMSGLKATEKVVAKPTPALHNGAAAN